MRQSTPVLVLLFQELIGKLVDSGQFRMAILSVILLNTVRLAPSCCQICAGTGTHPPPLLLPHLRRDLGLPRPYLR